MDIRKINTGWACTNPEPEPDMAMHGCIVHKNETEFVQAKLAMLGEPRSKAPTLGAKLGDNVIYQKPALARGMYSYRASGQDLTLIPQADIIGVLGPGQGLDSLRPCSTWVVVETVYADAMVGALYMPGSKSNSYVRKIGPAVTMLKPGDEVLIRTTRATRLTLPDEPVSRNLTFIAEADILAKIEA